jgi:hypothetical protein
LSLTPPLKLKRVTDNCVLDLAKRMMSQVKEQTYWEWLLSVPIHELMLLCVLSVLTLVLRFLMICMRLVDRALGSPEGRWRVATDVGNEAGMSHEASSSVFSDNEEGGHRHQDWTDEERTEDRPVPTMSVFGEHMYRGMGVRRKKVYAMRHRVRPGIFFSWEECRKQTDRFTGTEHRSFRGM